MPYLWRGLPRPYREGWETVGVRFYLTVAPGCGSVCVVNGRVRLVDPRLPPNADK